MSERPVGYQMICKTCSLTILCFHAETPRWCSRCNRSREFDVAPLGEIIERTKPPEELWTVQGFVPHGPDRTLGFQGWKVHATRKKNVRVPVTITAFKPEE